MPSFRRILPFLVCLLFLLLAAAEPTVTSTTRLNNTEIQRSEDYDESYESEIELELSRLQDWSVYNYSSKEYHARPSIVKWNGKIYDPLSFKGAENDTFAVSFHLSTEVAVSAAQSRNATLFNVAVVQGNKEYKEMMAQMQQDLKGDRCIYYTETNWNPGWSWSDWGTETYTEYIRRLYNYARNGPPPPFSPDPTPVFSSILQSLKIATEEALQTKLNYTERTYGKGIHLSSPFEFNETFVISLDRAMNSLAPSTSPFWYIGPTVRPWGKWHDHSNDIVDYSRENGTKMAFEQARKGAEMMEFDPWYRYGDFHCGTYLVEEDMRTESEMRANGTWVEPMRKRSVPWECGSWEECWRAWPWRWRFKV